MHGGLRRALHAASAALIAPVLLVPWPQVQALLLAVALAAAVLESLRLTLPGVGRTLERVIPVWRPSEAHRPSGAAWLAVAFALAGRAPMDAAIGGILAAAWADPAASLVGRRWGGGRAKSVPGSVAALVVAAGAAMLAGYAPPVAGVAGLVAAACERWAVQPDDNLWVAPSVALTLLAFA